MSEPMSDDGLMRIRSVFAPGDRIVGDLRAEVDRLRAALDRVMAERDEVMANEVQCCGLCLTSSDIGVPVAGNPVAVAHMACPKHADPVAFGMRADRMLDAEQARADRAERERDDALAALTRVHAMAESLRSRYVDQSGADYFVRSFLAAATIRAIENGESNE